MQQPTEDDADAAPMPLTPPRSPARRRSGGSLLGLLGIGLTLYCAWSLATAASPPGMPTLQAWGGMVGGLILVGASFWRQRRQR